MMTPCTKTLYQQAIDFAHTTYAKMEVEPEEEFDKWFYGVVAEKFAELIVQECLDVIGEENYTMLTGKAYCTRLKRHFGIE